MAAYTTIDDPELYFQAKTYSGTGSSNALTLDGEEDMQPDMVWIKCRNSAQDNILFDSVRGTNKSLRTDSTNVEDTSNNDGYLSAFGSNGFTVTAGSSGDDKVNDSSKTYVAWCWKAGTAFSNDASATSVGSIDSAGSINTTSGISIIGWSGTADVQTLAHGISEPEFIIVKRRTGGTEQWPCYHKSIGNTHVAGFLNLTDAKYDDQPFMNDTSPTSSVFTVGTTNQVNASGTDNMIAYLFSGKQGFSKFGSYTGNGSTDGTFINLGFRPAWFLCKNTTDAGDNWILHDNKRDTFNVTDNGLAPNDSGAEFTDVDMDFLSNGVKMRNNTGRANSAKTFIYMAFAEAPFVNSEGVPCNAR